MNKTEMIERIEQAYNLAAEHGVVELETSLHDLLIDCGAAEPEHDDAVILYYTLEQIKPVYGTDFKVVAAMLKIRFNGSKTGYLTCEGSGGAMALWFNDPSDAYEDLMSSVFNSSMESDRVGYICEPYGMYDQFIMPVDNCLEEEPLANVARTVAEHELYQVANRAYELLTYRELTVTLG